MQVAKAGADQKDEEVSVAMLGIAKHPESGAEHGEQSAWAKRQSRFEES